MTRSGQIVLGSRHRARRNGADGDGAQLPIELALNALDGADADLMLGSELANAGAALLQGVPDFALDRDRDRWPAETLALGASTSKAGADSVLNDAALELAAFLVATDGISGAVLHGKPAAVTPAMRNRITRIEGTLVSL